VDCPKPIFISCIDQKLPSRQLQTPRNRSLDRSVDGRIDSPTPFGSLAIKQAEAKAIKILGVMGDKSEFLPTTPTSGEQGFPGLVYDSCLSILAPAKTPQTIVKKLEGLLEKAHRDASFVQKVRDLAFEPKFLNSEKTVKYLEGEIRWGEVIKKANIKTQ
jgi:tripartite-type tricarboxylate transporter receptor subunit TctC